MLMKKPNHRVFDYNPRFYSPASDEKERKKRKLGFARERKYAKKKRNPVLWLVLALMVAYIFMKLQGLL